MPNYNPSGDAWDRRHHQADKPEAVNEKQKHHQTTIEAERVGHSMDATSFRSMRSPGRCPLPLTRQAKPKLLDSRGLKGYRCIVVPRARGSL